MADDFRIRRRALIADAAQQLAQAQGTASAYDEITHADPVAQGEEGPSVGRGQEAAGEAASTDVRLETWLGQAVRLLRVVSKAGTPRGGGTARSLVRSVIRPLCDEFGRRGGSEDAANLAARTAAVNASRASDAEADLVSFAVELGIAAAAPDASPQLIEAAAALERLAPENAGGLPAMSASPQLRVSPDGPYLLTGNAELVDYLGVTTDRPTHAALCRCGRSSTKPFCDGSHAAAAFSGDKDANRVPDKRDTYVGQQVTIYDNRGLCAHSGFCTDRLNSVFHLGEEPFVTPSGGRLDDIIRAVRKCPSGALSFGLDGAEDRQHVDQPRLPRVEISKDGPYRITGTIELLDAKGSPVVRPEGTSAEHYSLCRCGSSLNKPFCSGMHWSVAFADSRPDLENKPTLFEWARGYTALLDMTTLFYSRHVPEDPLIGPLFSNMAPDHPERVASWLSEVFGGPKLYSERYGGYARMISQHVGKGITQEQRARWASLMVQSADEAGLPIDPEFRAAFIAISSGAHELRSRIRNRVQEPPPNMPMPQWWWVCNAAPGARVSALSTRPRRRRRWRRRSSIRASSRASPRI